MPTPQDRYEINLELVTIAGTVYAMQTDLSYYEDVAELEDDILCFLPTVSELDVFGCELELLNLQNQLCLPSDFHNIGPRACENCKSLVEVNLMDTEITALPSSTFAHCVALNSIWLPPRTHANRQRSFSELCGTARSCHPDGAQGYRQPCILWV